MKMHIIKVFILSVFLLGICSEGMAISAYGDDLDGPPSKEQREKVRKRIETMRMWKLTKALDLDEKTASRLFPMLNDYDKKRKEVEREIRKDIDFLKEALELKEESRIKDLLEVLEQKHNTLKRLGDEERNRLREVLTIEQQARYLIFKMEFRREIRRMIAEAKGRRHKMGGKEGYGSP
jgi:Spy/CpxP family protein refolding chaperone